MALIANNPLLKGISGMLGKLIVFREVRGKIVLSNRPKRSGKLTVHQEMMRSRFQCAVHYAKKQMQNEQRKAEYSTGINDRKHSAYAVALTDYMTAPKVTAMDVSGYIGEVSNTIIIHATDDFKVTEVLVTITDNKSIIIEQGNAILQPDKEGEWHYSITKTNSTLAGTHILAKAMDQPGNVGWMEVIINKQKTVSRGRYADPA